MLRPVATPCAPPTPPCNAAPVWSSPPPPATPKPKPYLLSYELPLWPRDSHPPSSFGVARQINLPAGDCSLGRLGAPKRSKGGRPASGGKGSALDPAGAGHPAPATIFPAGPHAGPDPRQRASPLDTLPARAGLDASLPFLPERK